MLTSETVDFEIIHYIFLILLYNSQIYHFDMISTSVFEPQMVLLKRKYYLIVFGQETVTITNRIMRQFINCYL